MIVKNVNLNPSPYKHSSSKNISSLTIARSSTSNDKPNAIYRPFKRSLGPLNPSRWRLESSRCYYTAPLERMTNPAVFATLLQTVRQIPWICPADGWTQSDVTVQLLWAVWSPNIKWWQKTWRVRFRVQMRLVIMENNLGIMALFALFEMMGF